MLTQKLLGLIPCGIYFAINEGIYRDISKNKIKWVAEKIDKYKWVIYFAKDPVDWDKVEDNGKRISKDKVRKLIDCDDEALNYYQDYDGFEKKWMESILNF